jgi:hypothetical protein
MIPGSMVEGLDGMASGDCGRATTGERIMAVARAWAAVESLMVDYVGSLV